MSVNLFKDGELINIAAGSRVWIGTKEAHEQAVAAGTMPGNCIVCITDDNEDDALQDITDQVTATEAFLSGSYVIKKWGRQVQLLYDGTYDGSLVGTQSELLKGLPRPVTIVSVSATSGNDPANCMRYFITQAGSMWADRNTGATETHSRFSATYLTED